MGRAELDFGGHSRRDRQGHKRIGHVESCLGQIARARIGHITAGWNVAVLACPQAFKTTFFNSTRQIIHSNAIFGVEAEHAHVHESISRLKSELNFRAGSDHGRPRPVKLRIPRLNSRNIGHIG